MYSVAMGHLGSDAVAANSVANIVKNLLVCFCIGIGSGGRLCRLAILSGIASGALLLAFSPVILQFSALGSQAREYLKWMFVVCSYYLVGKSINITTIGGIFSAGGDTKFGLICDTVTLWCVTVPMGCIAAFVLKWPVLAVYFVLNLDEIVKLPVVYRHYKEYAWVNNLTQEAAVKAQCCDVV